MNPNEIKRIAYHEAGHAYLAYRLNYSEDLRVIVYSVPLSNKLGSTVYLKDQFKNLMTDRKHGQNLIEIAFGGRIAENLYDKQSNTSQAECNYSTSDDEFIKQVVKEMLLSEKEEATIKNSAYNNAVTRIESNSSVVQKIAEKLLKNLDKQLYYSDLSEIIMSIQ